jgi:2-(1,2-epoxy-1,2-dihydrophenyl)acetyl-CoA isomerase
VRGTSSDERSDDGGALPVCRGLAYRATRTGARIRDRPPQEAKCADRSHRGGDDHRAVGRRARRVRAGFDIVGRNATDARPRIGSIQRRLPTEAHRLVELLLSTQTPVVCRVQGWAAGIGLHLVLASDFAVVDESARLWEPYAQRGFTPDTGGTWLLARRIGEVRAREMLLLGEAVSGADAATWGMVHRAVPAADLDEVVQTLAERLAVAPTVTIGLTKWLLHAGSSSPLAEQLQNEALAMELSSRSEDFREGLAAFVEKRPPNFTGR